MNSKLVALTFDDGPSNITSSVIDVLEKEGVPGTFFLIGNNISEETSELIRRQVSLGYEICNHSLTHSDMTTLSSSEIKEEIDETTRLIKEITGLEPKFFRPPFISVNDTMFDSIDLPFICGLDSKDWDSSVTSDERVSNVLEEAKDGAIVLMHDFTDNYKTLEALPQIIGGLREQGFEFVTLSELFKKENINPKVHGKIWSFVI